MIAARALSAVIHVNQPLIVHPCLPLVLPVVQSEAEQLRSLTSLSIFPFAARHTLRLHSCTTGPTSLVKCDPTLLQSCCKSLSLL